MEQKEAPKLPEGPSYGNFRKVIQNPHFLKKSERGDQGKFFESRPKSSPQQIKLSSIYNALKGQRLEKILAQESGSKSARMTKLWQFWKGHPKPAFCKKVQTGDQGKFFKNRLKSSPRLKRPKAL